MDTIFALATAQGRAGVSVIRISGPSAWKACTVMCGNVPPVRQVSVRVIRSPEGEVIDEAVVLSFSGPESFTGEDVIELQVHGSVAVVQACLKLLSGIQGCRLAEAGEFTRRALENNRLDLAQVEGLADLIDAETEAQRRQAIRIFSGALGEKVEVWRVNLIRAAALLEATIDFADEEVPVDVTPEVGELLSGVIAGLSTEIDGSFVAERIRTGFEVAIVGPPNAGKSTLLNRLAGRDAAITSDIAGTTRDVIEVRMDLGGLPVTFLDTAGLRESEDEIEAIGVERALDRARKADLRVFLAGSSDDLMISPGEHDIVVTPKQDTKLGSVDGISGKTGQGVSDLIKRIQTVFSDRSAAAGIATHERHRVAMMEARKNLSEAVSIIRAGPEHYDIGAEELRSSIRILEVLVGRIDTESLLDEIFASFCLGK